MLRLPSLTLILTSFLLSALVPAQTAAPAGKGGSPQSPATKSAPAKSAPQASAYKGPQVDINSASMAELKSVPGIGDAYANKIVAGRPYKTKTQLKTRSILPAGVYEKTKEYLVAKQK